MLTLQELLATKIVVSHQVKLKGIGIPALAEVNRHIRIFLFADDHGRSLLGLVARPHTEPGSFICEAYMQDMQQCGLPRASNSHPREIATCK